MTLDLIGRRWPDGRVDVVLERAGERANTAHWEVVSAERLRLARAEQEARQRAYAEQERLAAWAPRDRDEHGNLDVYEQGRV